MERKRTERCTLGLVMISLAVIVSGVFIAVDTPTASAMDGARERATTASPSALPYTTFVDTTSSAPISLDPHWMYDTTSWQVVGQVYETLLMQERHDATAYIPLLATSWNVSADGKTYTFHIRPGVAFHEGGVLQPHDVAYSFWRGMLQDRDSGPMWILLSLLLGVYDVEDVASTDDAICQAVKNAVTYDDGAGTVTFHLIAAASPFLDALTTPFASMLDQEWMAANGDWSGGCATWRTFHNPASAHSLLYDQMNGTGPFRFDHWTAEEVGLLRFDAYWRTEPAWPEGPSGPAAFDTVLIKNEPDWATRRDMLLNGQADTIYVPGATAGELDPFIWGVYEGFEDREPTLVNLDTGILRLYNELPTASQTAILFAYNIDPNNNPYIGSGALDGDGIPPNFFADIHVRKAFNHALDWSTTISDAYNGAAVRSLGPIPKGMLGYDEAQPAYAFDLALSAQEFQQAWAGQLWTEGFSMTVAYNEGNLVRQQMLDTLSQNLAAVNPAFHVNVISLTWAELMNQVGARRMPAYPGGWMEDYHHPHNWVHPYLHSSGTFGSYQAFPAAIAALFDAKVEECLLVTDPAAAQTCYAALQNMSYEHAAAGWGVQGVGHHYERTEVRGYYYNPARPPYYYALSKGPQPESGEADPLVDSTLVFSETGGTTTTVDVPAGAISETSTIVYTPDAVVEESYPGGMRLGGITFDLQVCQGGDCLDDYVFAEPVSITLDYTDADVLGLIEQELYLYTWNGSEWVDVVADCGWPLTAYGRYPDINRLVVPVCHFSLFTLVGDTHTIYLPLVVRSYP